MGIHAAALYPPTVGCSTYGAIEISMFVTDPIGIIGEEEATKMLEKKGFRIWDVNPGTYVVFDCVGEDGDCIAKTWVKFYKEFLPQMGYEASEQTDYELYFDGTRPEVFCELWIPIKKK